MQQTLSSALRPAARLLVEHPVRLLSDRVQERGAEICCRIQRLQKINRGMIGDRGVIDMISSPLCDIGSQSAYILVFARVSSESGSNGFGILVSVLPLALGLMGASLCQFVPDLTHFLELGRLQ